LRAKRKQSRSAANQHRRKFRGHEFAAVAAHTEIMTNHGIPEP
jgi:hypothetical protein